MLSFIRHPKDFWTGVIFLVFGLGAVFIAREYSMGSAARMGPGYFPTVLGGLLALIGLIGVIRSFIVRGEAIERFAIKEILIILSSILLFGFLIRGAGIAPAVIALVLLSGIASAKFRVRAALLLAIGLAVFSVLVFVKLLGLPLAIIGPWFGV